MGWGEKTNRFTPEGNAARIEALGRRIAELEDEVAVMTVVLIGVLTTLRTTATLSTRHAEISALLDALAPETEAG